LLPATCAALVTYICLIAATPAEADACDALAAEVTRVTGARRAEMAANLRFQHPAAETIVVYCPHAPGIHVTWRDAYPPDVYFDMVAVLREITFKTKTAATRAVAIQCQQAALRSSTDKASRSLGKLTMRCVAFTRLGGATSIVVEPTTFDPNESIK
jgi:hypothetical protein